MDIMAGASQLSDGTVSPQITFLGHSTLIIELDGVRLLTDPLLRDKVTFLQRNYPPLTSSDYAGCFDAVLISHMHYDHLDVRSLALLGKDVPLVTPRGGNRVLRPAGFQNVLEVGVGKTCLPAASVFERCMPIMMPGAGRSAASGAIAWGM